MTQANDWIAKQTGEVTLYHGTSKARLSSINEDGLTCYASFGADRGQPAGVFCTPPQHKRYAQYWANKKAKEDNSSPIVLQVTVNARDVVPDPINPRCFLIVTRDIAPDAIAQIDDVAMVENMSFSDMTTYAIAE